MRLRVDHALPLVLIAVLAGCGSSHGPKLAKLTPPVANGPAADYPMVLGDPFKVGDRTYTPEDKLNYDAVGYAASDAAGGEGVSGAHKTLPLPSYVEVTSLASGKTVLVRVERRGPMSNDELIELSPGAAAQLSLAGEGSAAVRVRRVNPPEQERAMLRAGGRAPERMETPRGLLDALNRKLAASVPARPAPARTAARPVQRPARTASTAPATAKPAPAPQADPAPASAPAAHGELVVQVAAFSTSERARGAASKLGAQVSSTGRLWRVRMGPFASRDLAEATLAKARAAGYSDARIQRAD